MIKLFVSFAFLCFAASKKVYETHTFLHFNHPDTGAPEYLEVMRMTTQKSCLEKGRNCGRAVLLNTGAGSTYRPLLEMPDGRNWGKELAMAGYDFWSYVPRGMGHMSSHINGSTFGVASMFSDLERVTAHVLGKNIYSRENGGVVQMGVSLGGDVVMRYNSRHGSESPRKLCGTMEIGGPYRTLYPLFMDMLAPLQALPFDEIPSPLTFDQLPDGSIVSTVETEGELEREMVRWDLAHNIKMKRMLMEDGTGFLPIGPFKNDFANFDHIAWDWEHTTPDVPVCVINGFKEKTVSTPDVILGFSNLKSARATMYAPLNSGHFAFWELDAYDGFMFKMLDNVKEYDEYCVNRS